MNKPRGRLSWLHGELPLPAAVMRFDDLIPWLLTYCDREVFGKSDCQHLGIPYWGD